ncbi:MAG: tRNA ((1)-)-methyltransferase [Deltaproteobacteria bacterium]|nr:tRNA ((1)-)-methyltransferase [Deltaproteobacteria bacterium]
MIPNLPRNAQVVYPKDLGPILIWADLFPGARVVEAGAGAGALSMTLLRAIGSSGQLITYEIREDFADMARKTLSKYFGPTPNWTLKVSDVETELVETDVDRVVLDLPEPWKVIDRAWNALRPGGILLSYLPTVTARRQTFCLYRNYGNTDAVLAHQGHERPAATPHGRPYRVFDCGAPFSRWRKRYSPSFLIGARERKQHHSASMTKVLTKAGCSSFQGQRSRSLSPWGARPVCR